ncbi:DMT family transporter [Alienimonas sp. DA493]|uniref:DMT family transporter n=1 Tax=Alienimonas sp. DA493 TaxID=3373605 RepID=UPI003754B534
MADQRTEDAPDDRSKSRPLAWAQLLAGMTIFGSGTPVSKIVTEGFPVALASGGRMLLGAAVLAPVLFLRERPDFKALTKKDWAVVAGVAVIGMVAFSLAMLYGMQRVSGVTGSIVMSTTPAITAVGAWLFLGNHLGWRKIAAVICAVVGVATLHLAGGADGGGESGGGGGNGGWMNGILLGGGLILIAVCCEATYTLLGRVGSDALTPVTLATLSAAAAAALFLPFALWQGVSFDWAAPSWRQWAGLAWWGAGTLALGSALWYAGVKKVPGSIAAGFMGVMPVSALVLSYVLLNETFRWVHLLGFGIVFAGVLLIAWAHARMDMHDD